MIEYWFKNLKPIGLYFVNTFVITNFPLFLVIFLHNKIFLYYVVSVSYIDTYTPMIYINCLLIIHEVKV